MKRIICSILVAVMLVLSLASCGYSFMKDDMTKYADFNKTEFENFIKNILIENGEFEADPATREEKVLQTAKFYTRAIETFIEEHPEQWFWMHERWKTKFNAQKKFRNREQ